MIPVQIATRHIEINAVDERIFSSRCFPRCSDCSFCHDTCCSYGCEVDMGERDKILLFSRELEAELGIPSYQWFEETVTSDPEYPSGEVVRTKVRRNRCVFSSQDHRGCHLTKVSAPGGIGSPRVKPMVCSIFPVTWDRGRLLISDFLDDLPCKGHGIPIFEAQKEELRIHFGDALITELERMASDNAAKKFTNFYQKTLDRRPSSVHNNTP